MRADRAEGERADEPRRLEKDAAAARRRRDRAFPLGRLEHRIELTVELAVQEIALFPELREKQRIRRRRPPGAIQNHLIRPHPALRAQ